MRLVLPNLRKDFFSKFDESGDGQIDSEELMKGGRNDQI